MKAEAKASRDLGYLNRDSLDTCMITEDPTAMYHVRLDWDVAATTAGATLTNAESYLISSG